MAAPGVKQAPAKMTVFGGGAVGQFLVAHLSQLQNIDLALVCRGATYEACSLQGAGVPFCALCSNLETGLAAPSVHATYTCRSAAPEVLHRLPVVEQQLLGWRAL